MVKGGVSRGYVKMLICIPMILSFFITNIKQEKRASGVGFSPNTTFISLQLL